jgi:hypothetical protein
VPEHHQPRLLAVLAVLVAVVAVPPHTAQQLPQVVRAATAVCFFTTKG